MYVNPGLTEPNLMRDAKMDRIQETLDDIKYWEIRNGGRK